MVQSTVCTRMLPDKFYSFLYFAQTHLFTYIHDAAGHMPGQRDPGQSCSIWLELMAKGLGFHRPQGGSQFWFLKSSVL